MAIGYLSKDEPWEVEWRGVLAFLAAKKRVTAKELALELGLGHEIRVVEFRGPNRREVVRMRHTGPSEANTRLRRLADWGMARVEKEPGMVNTFVVTKYGLEVDKNPGLKKTRKKGRQP
jgi:hypothetical protein